MMRSLFSGVSGLMNHQIRMDVLGNNIANVNTSGFKASRVTFQDLISQNLSGAARPTDEKGGMNPKQIGLGMNVASIDTLMKQGSIQVTGERTDVAINGDGFFVLQKGDEKFYTRAGNFSVDGSKRLVNPNGFMVQGWNALINTDGSSRLEATGDTQGIVVPIGEKFPAKATDAMVLKSNLNANTEIGGVHRTSLSAFDSQGNAHAVELTFTKLGVNQWQVEANVVSDTIVPNSVRLEVGNPDRIPTYNDVDMPNPNRGVITFDDTGAIRSVSETPALDMPAVIGEGDLSFNLTFTVQNSANPTIGYDQTVNLQVGTAGVSNDGITQFSSASTTKFVNQDGYELGYLREYNVDANGVIKGTYTNGQTRELAQIALGSFINDRGLTRTGDTNFQESINSGIVSVGTANSQGKGSITPASLEMSNVDLAEQFTDMIITQRGYQANSRTIATTDQLLQELLMLKR